MQYLAYRLPPGWDPGASLEAPEVQAEGRVGRPGEAPAHLPRQVGRGACWLLGCRGSRTDQLTARIRQLAARARSQAPEVYVDADPLDSVARAAILAAGLEPAGVIRTGLVGRWERTRPHPELRRFTAADPSPLALPGWLDFNRWRWRLEPLAVRLEGDQAALETVLYKNRNGRLCTPPLSPYLPIAFLPSPTSSPIRLGRQWLEVGQALAEELARHPIYGPLRLPPEVRDVRPFTWRGFQMEPVYTYLLDLPLALEQTDHSVRKNIAKARRQGFSCGPTRDYAAVCRCLAETEERKSFTYLLQPPDLEQAVRLVGEEHLRVLACFGPQGEMVGAQVALHAPGGRALDLVVGIRTEYRTSGAAQLLMASLLDQLTAAGATGFDHAGADIRVVARAKANWGGELTTVTILRAPGLRQLARQGRAIWRYFRPR
ncbi:MAG: hypothetical protein AMXMBFR33_65580 [Candidatus Xenobia bacterium]